MWTGQGNFSGKFNSPSKNISKLAEVNRLLEVKINIYYGLG
jgi:hypothetical protein